LSFAHQKHRIEHAHNFSAWLMHCADHTDRFGLTEQTMNERTSKEEKRMTSLRTAVMTAIAAAESRLGD